MTIACILFDCDGTLVDSEMLASRAYQQLFSQFGVELDTQQVHDRYKGMKVYDILASLAATHSVLPSPHELEPAFRENLTRLMEEELTVIDGVEELISSIAVPIGVVSNGPREKIQHSMRLTGLDRWFGEHLYSAFDYQCWKPDPLLLIKACEALNVAPADTILVDDSVSGVLAGINAGMKVWYFAEIPDPGLARRPEVHVFTKMSELPDLWRSAGMDVVK
ncbi:6-phosphogluconate phosphatase [Acerihabitans sp. KWT182]|uniref:6-phosphogluconate phosphatase n=1 Tax=Acerihabitans sp. KWT182 TaxID=3157919 RepID=A0AAU7QBW9_9GAMM